MTPESADLKDLSVLIVEDNAFTAIVIRKTLDALGITDTDVACDGREALEMLDGMVSPSEVIMLDLRMPNMGGVEFLTRLADRKYGGSVIVLSGVDEETLASVESMAIENNIRLLGSLPKPPNPKDVSELLLRISATT